jgi:hypothetical protein
MLMQLTPHSVADSRVVPKLQSNSPYPSRSEWHSISVAVVATRDCTFHYVSENCPQAEHNASRILISFLQRYPINFVSHDQFFIVISLFGSHRHEKASSNLVPISGASRQFDRLMDSFASADPESASQSDGKNSPDAGAKREAAVPAALSKLALPARPAETAFEALHSSGVGDIWVPPLTSRGRPSPTQPSHAGIVISRPTLRDSDNDDESGSNVSGNDEPDGEVAMLVQHPSLEVLESFDTDDLWESRLFWLVPLAPVQGAPSDSVYAHNA